MIFCSCHIIVFHTFNIGDFARIQCNLCESTAIRLANTLVTNRLDYYNSLFVQYICQKSSSSSRHSKQCLFADFLVYHRHTLKSQLNYSSDYIAPLNWNSLPDTVSLLALSVQTFRKRLKTYLLPSLFSSVDTFFLLSGCLGF